jgi:hypothetical protein
MPPASQPALKDKDRQEIKSVRLDLVSLFKDPLIRRAHHAIITIEEIQRRNKSIALQAQGRNVRGGVAAFPLIVIIGLTRFGSSGSIDHRFNIPSETMLFGYSLYLLSAASRNFFAAQTSASLRPFCTLQYSCTP